MCIVPTKTLYGMLYLFRKFVNGKTSVENQTQFVKSLGGYFWKTIQVIQVGYIVEILEQFLIVEHLVSSEHSLTLQITVDQAECFVCIPRRFVHSNAQSVFGIANQYFVRPFSLKLSSPQFFSV